MEYLSTREKLTIMSAILASLLFATLNQTIISTALPRIASDLHGMEYFNWVLVIYLLTSCITAVLTGKLSDLYGRKPFLLIGLGIFLIGSFLCGTSKSMMQLVIYRGLQGFGAGMVTSSAFASVGDLFPPRERGRWQGLLSGTFGIANMLGPLLGGYIVDHLHWHWVFWCAIPIGLLAFALITWLFPYIPNNKVKSIDYLGALFLTLTIVPVLLAFSIAGRTVPWFSPQIFGLLIGSLISLFLFIFIEKRAENAILPLFLFQNKVFLIANIINFILIFGMFGPTLFTPFFVQGVLGKSATSSSYVMLPMPLGMVSASITTGQILSRTGRYKPLAIFGLSMVTCVIFSLTLIDAKTTLLSLAIRMFLLGLGLGTSFPIFTLSVQNAVEYRHLGVATSSVQLFRQLGGTIGISLGGSIFTLTLVKYLPVSEFDVNQSLTMNFSSFATNQQSMVQQALTHAITNVFITELIALALAVILAIFLKEIPLRKTNQNKSDWNTKSPSPIQHAK